MNAITCQSVSAGPGATVWRTRRSLADRWVAALAAAWQRRRAHSHWLAEQRLLETLNDATLHDIGLAERSVRQPTLSLADYERGRW